MKQIILASGSSRRKELLEKAGLDFEIEPSSYEEDMTKSMPPKELAKHLSEGKATDVAKNHSNAIVIGGDTIVVYRNQVIGKPKDNGDAKRMLRMFSGKEHLVITGYTIIDADTGKSISKAVETKVYFKKLSQKVIDNYVASGEPVGHAGSYAIQGLGGELIKKYEGDFGAVVGLPMKKLLKDLEKFN